MKIELAVFDLAGTTVKDNQDVQRILQRAMSKFDTYITLDEAATVMGIPKPVAIRQLLEKYGDDLTAVTDEQVGRIYDSFVTDMISFYQHNPSVVENEGVSEVFGELQQRGIKVAVDTGFSRAITDILLARLGWVKSHLIDFSVTSDEVRRGRPFPDMIHQCMKRLNVQDPASVAKIGDTVSDLQEGNAAGCGLVIGITSGACSHEYLKQEDHTHLIERIPEILAILNPNKQREPA